MMPEDDIIRSLATVDPVDRIRIIEQEMSLNDYGREVLRTARRGEYPTGISPEREGDFDALIWGLGLTGEAGEVADLLKKGIGHSHGTEKEKVCKELGDVLWYIGALAHRFGFTMEEVARANVEKLRKRYPDGFTVEASKNRADR